MSSTKDNYGIVALPCSDKIIAGNKENEKMAHTSYIQQTIEAVVHESIQQKAGSQHDVPILA